MQRVSSHLMIKIYNNNVIINFYYCELHGTLIALRTHNPSYFQFHTLRKLTSGNWLHSGFISMSVSHLRC